MYKTLIQLVLLLILILIIFFIYNKYFYTENKIDEVKNTNSLSKESVEKKNLIKKNMDNEIINISYEKFDTNGNKYFINAKKGTIDNENPNIIYMNEVEASLIYLNNERLIIYSKEAIFNKENFKTTFSKNVKLLYQEQTLESDNLEFLIDKNIAIFRDNVKYYNQDIQAFADIVNINLITKEIDIKSENQKKIKIKKNN
ncbi:LPS export ABC transporter periplasmic protein LptC [Candidatus Pelagibacter sp.]|nr:LPS export ABC transporter periplasmic protein LptC [Candidatus Pelagibacter sp.]